MEMSSLLPNCSGDPCIYRNGQECTFLQCFSKYPERIFSNDLSSVLLFLYCFSLRESVVDCSFDFSLDYVSRIFSISCPFSPSPRNGALGCEISVHIVHSPLVASRARGHWRCSPQRPCCGSNESLNGGRKQKG